MNKPKEIKISYRNCSGPWTKYAAITDMECGEHMNGGEQFIIEEFIEKKSYLAQQRLIDDLKQIVRHQKHALNMGDCKTIVEDNANLRSLIKELIETSHAAVMAREHDDLYEDILNKWRQAIKKAE